MKAIDELIQAFSRLPGIGSKSASRLTYHLIQNNSRDNKQLGELIGTIQDKIRLCSICGSFTEDDLCEICTDTSRERDLLCVVEEPQDVLTLETASAYQGLYHVLTGAISPLDGIGPEQLTISLLLERIQQGSFQEVILATNPNESGDTTAIYITHLLKKYPVRISRLASGLPVGGDLEYTDRVTLARSLRGRILMEK
ncbi:MAG: recombination mediator RecR [Spirochaetales bacterium]|jgi:recombination protein RecR|nr:recombination mediator RecR [Spirochaetales bacterium]